MATKFSLQTVLDYRHQRVTTLEVELSQLVQAWHRAQAVLTGHAAHHTQLLATLREKQAGLLNLGHLELLRRNVKQAERAIVQQQAVVAAAHELALAKQTELVSARQAEEALEKLKAQAQARWQAAEAQHDQRQRDDIYSARSYQRRTHDQAGANEAAA